MYMCAFLQTPTKTPSVRGLTHTHTHTQPKTSTLCLLPSNARPSPPPFKLLLLSKPGRERGGRRRDDDEEMMTEEIQGDDKRVMVFSSVIMSLRLLTQTLLRVRQIYWQH